MKKWFSEIKLKNCIIALASSVVLAFGLYNVHATADITEGGMLGLTLLLDYWFNITPAISSFIFNVICYLIGWKVLGRKFIIYSFFATFGFSLSYRIFELFPPVFPAIYEYPLIASILGAIFVGVTIGICVKIGGAPTGDDALAMSISKSAKIKIEWIYLIMDIIVLGLSLTYIPFSRIIYSLISVIISGQLVGLISRSKKNKTNII
ncbi:MAG: YitT family protein [Bacilli bacterium]|nr:YitT family protein [Bacilli bacterium]